jgi:Raf kinase inhibitor-like YbhB/YbcL family protein
MRALVVLAALLLALASAGALVPLTVHASFEGGRMIDRRHTCDGADISPPVRWSKAPPETRSIAIVLDDPDAPGGVFTHWLVWGLSPSTTALGEGRLPSAARQGTNDFDRPGYSGPCPPRGALHHYHLVVYALDAMPSLPSGARRAAFDAALRGHVLARGEAVGVYRH